MKVELRQSKFYNVPLGPLQIVEVPDELAKKWIEKGHAVPVDDSLEVTGGLALEDKTAEELRETAKAVGVKASGKSKDQLTEEIRTADALNGNKE